MPRGFSNTNPIDTVSGNMLILEPEHGAIHDGVHFTASWSGTTATTLNTLITTGTARSGIIHFAAEADGNKAFTFELWESPTATGGTAVTSYNNSRLSSNTTPITITKNPTITTVGTTLLEAQRVGSSNPASRIGGGAKHSNEWVLKASTKYLLQVTAVSAGTIVITRMPYYYRK
jgi:hypothetical protein